MSWFDASGFANIAKSALREAQRTIDKALDIKEDEISTTVPSNTPIDPNSEDFFGTWGITHSGNIITEPNKATSTNENVANTLQPSLKLQSSLWGSFTGSFFDAAAANKGEPLSPSIDLDDSLDTVGLNERFKGSKLVVQQHSEDIEPIIETEEEMVVANKEENSAAMVDILLDNSPSESNDQVVKKRDKPSSAQINRLSIVSCESGKNSSESVELITCSTECTTSPDESSDLLSTEHSTSTSSALAKQTSDSVEILVDSVTSPSSIEMLALDEFASPLESPIVEEVVLCCTEKISPESVEVIPMIEDQEEDTMSYTSISESTSATVLDHLMKPQNKMLKDTYESDMSLSPDKTTSFNNSEAITRAPSRLGSMHLPLAQVNQVLIDTQPQSSSRQDLSHILNNTNIIDIPQEMQQQIISSSSESNLIESSCDESSQSDRTIIAGGMDSSSDTTTSTTEPMNGEFLKNLLADAMSEKADDNSVKSLHFMDLTQSMIDSSSSETGNILENISITQLDMIPSPPRQISPLSSESRSDLVKISSASSGHTSGDELETTTSSDIEIISSPNGDSSSTQSRQSPVKLTSAHSVQTLSRQDKKIELLCKMTMKKAKGHNRELSEASSISDDSHYSSDGRMDRLVKRMAEMTEILESRESKLIDMNRRNAELQELNVGLKQQLDSVLSKQLESADLSQVTEEYTQRLSALEKKFQQAIREKDTLRKQLDQSKQEAATRMSKTELESLISEKDETIKELREEGEKLSKQQLQHSNIIKKLRVKEKENETCIKHLKETIEDLSSEMDRLKRSLAAKEEVERSQIEAVHQLTAKNKKCDTELAKLQSLHDDLNQKYETAKKSLDAAKKELVDKTRTSSELMAREHKLESLENEKRQTESQNAAILGELEDLRVKLRQLESDHVKKEQELRKANVDLLRRLEDAEARNEELLSQSMLEVSKPLVRQLDSLQATHTLKIGHFEKIEQELTLKINELQGRLQSSLNSERVVKDESVILRSKVSDLECEQSSLKHKNEMVKMELEQYKTEKQLAENELNSQINKLKDELRLEKEKSEQAVAQLQDQLLLNIEKASASNERERKKSVAQDNNSFEHPTNGSNSPTLSLGKASVAESVGSSSFWWSQDELFEGGGGGGVPPPRYTNMFEMQMLQSNLKQRDGEVQQLQWELNRREQERSLLNSEISTLLTRVDDLEVRVKENEGVQVQLGELQQQYDTLCQLYGEKVEENEELKLDLQDVKDMYKSQIDELLKQQKQQL